MSDLPVFHYNPDLTPIESIDWSKVTAVVIGGNTYPVGHVETTRDEVRFRLPGADDIVEVVA